MKKIFSLFLLVTALLSLPMSLRAEDLTVADGTSTNNYLPVYGLWVDTQGTRGQCLYSSDLLGDMEGGQISKLTFYLSSPASVAWTGTFNVYLGATSKTDLSSSFESVSNLTLVYTGTLDATGSTMEISLETPYTYEGGNLLLDITVATAGNYKSASFYGSSISGAGRYFYNTTEGAADFLPKTTFTYEAAATGPCPKPGNLAVSNVKAHSADLSWVEKGTATAWQICLNDDEDNLINASKTSYSFSGLAPLTSYSVKVRANCGSDYSEWTAAKNFTTTSACPYVITFDPVITVSTSTAEINVAEATGEAEAIEARYFHDADTISLDSEANEIDFKGEEGAINLVNLLPATTYGIQVRAYCEEEGAYGEWSAVTNFTTKCEAVSAIDENFDGITAGSGVLPTCWSRINEATSSYYNYYPYVYNSSSSAHSGSNSLYFYTSYSSSYADEYAILPELDNLSGKRIVFWAKQGSSAATLQVGEMTDPADASTFIQTGSNVTLSSSYQKFTINLEGNGNYVAFKVVKPTSSSISVYIDDIVVEEVPSCLEPSGLSFVSATTTSAILNWNAGGSESAWDIYYSKENVAPTAEAAPVLSGVTEKAISGLEAASTYYVWVRAHCSGSEHSAWSEGISFQTECAAFALPFSENFDDLAAGIPVCWDNSEGTTTNADYKWNAYSSGYEGKCLRFNSYNNSNNLTNILATPVIHLSANSQMTFMCKNSAGGAFKVQIAIAGSSDRTDLLTGLTGISSWTEKSVDLSAYTGQDVIIYFHATSNFGNGDAYLYLDNLSIEAIPSCYALKQISVSDISRRSMIVNLTPKSGHDLANAHELVYSTSELDEAALEAADKIAINDTNAYEISGLERDTKYYLYVRANCGSEEGKSAWVSTSAKTKALSACDPIQIGSGNNTANLLYTSYGNTYSQHIYTAEELLDAGYQAGTLSAVSFQYSGTSSTYDKTQSVYIGTTSQSSFSGNAATDFIGSLTLVYGPTELQYQSGWREYTFATPFEWDGESNIVVAMLSNSSASSASGWSAYGTAQSESRSICRYKDSSPINIDDLAGTTSYGASSSNRPNIQFSFCYELPACPSVSDLSFELVGEGTSEAIVRWNIANADYLSGFDVIKSEAEITDFAGIEPTYANIQFDSIDLQGLNAATPYYIYVRAICKAESHDDGNSEWAGIHFTTNADCPLVQNLQAELTDLNKVKASWDLAFAEQEKHFQYILSETEMNEAALEAGAPVAIDDTTAFEIDGLDYDKEYHLYVASVCGAAHSDYQHASFSTLPSCQKVENLAVARVAHNLVELTWTSAQFASEAQWKVGIVGDPVAPQIVSERHAILFGLNTESAYEAYVIALCDGESLSDSVKVAFLTAAQPGNCAQVGEGTSSDNMPVTNYNYAYTQMIYGADLIGQSGTITSLQLKRSTYANVMNNMKVYLGTTSKATFASSSDWVAEEDLKLVYEGSFPAGSSAAPDLELTLSEPYVYNGSDNLVVAISNGHGDWNNIQKFYYTSAYNTVLYRRSDDEASYANHPGSAAGYGISSYRTNIQFCFEPKACPDVKALAISDITTSSAKASWEPMGSEVAWNVFISNAAVSDFSDLSAYEVVRVSELHKSFTGLLDDTDYFVYVQVADCEGADFVGTNFRTIAACLKQNAPAVVAESIAAHAAIVKWIDPNAAKAGQYTVAYAKADEFDLENPEIATIQVIDTFASLAALQADTVYKFAVKADCGETGASRWSDVAQFQTLESCFTPTAPVVVAENITAHSATVAWTDAHDDAAYIVAYGPYADDPATYETKNATDTFVVLDNLNSATRYAFRVKGDCSSDGEGESKNWSTSMNFYTACEAYALPFSEDFENENQFNLCWTKGNVQDPNSSSYIPYRSSSAAANGSNNGLYMNACVSSSSWSPTEADSSYAVLPELAFGEESITDYQISFNAKAYTSSYGDYYPHLKIGVADDDALTNLQIIADTALSTEAFQEIELSFAPYTGTGKRIVLLATVDPNSTATSRYGRIYVDDIYVSKLSDCKRPASITVSNITETSASFAWVAGGGETDFEYVIVASGATPDWSAAVPVNDAASVEVTEGLSASTAYDFYVRANCGEEKKSDARSISFRTACGAVALPFIEEFEEGLGCWTMIDCHEETGLSASAEHNGGNYGFRFRYNSNPPQYLISPELITSERDVEVSFYYKVESDYYEETFMVGHSSTTADITAFTWSEEITAQNDDSWLLYTDTIDAGVKYIAIKYTSNDKYYLFIDGFSAREVKAGEGSGIDNVGLESEQAVKFIKDDRIYILRNGILYDVTGRLIRK